MKTVIDELIKQLERTIPAVKNGNAIDKAYWKEKEKQQIIDSNNAGYKACRRDLNQNAEDYYNETYNNNETKTSN